jgi:hypothetical protein
MKCPAEVYIPSRRPYRGIPELEYPFHDRDVLVTACGRICIYRKNINVSTILAGQRLGIREVDEGIWLVSFIDYDLGYGLGTENLATRRQPVRHEVVTYVIGTNCYLCLRAGQKRPWRREWDSNPRYGCPYTRFPSVRLQPLGHPSLPREQARI